jgi:hypothetical protein
VTKRRRKASATARWMARPFERDAVVRDQTPMLPHPLSVRRPSVSRDVGASSQHLEFATQPAQLFEEAHVFGAEIRELFCGGQLLLCKRNVTNLQHEDNHNIS